MKQEVLELRGGYRLVYKESASMVAHCGWVIQAGTRDEQENEAGLAHFLEHMLFKGTQKRSAFHILNTLELVGGELNAYTTKEKTTVYASVMDQYVPKAIDLLSDIVFRASFPEKELQKEKTVVIDEIKTYLDIPEELVYDEFEAKCFPSHPLGHYILGTEAQVQGFTQTQLNDFRSRLYLPQQMVFSYCGPRKPEEVMKLLERHLPSESSLNTPHKRQSPLSIVPFQEEVSWQGQQAYQVLGYEAPSLHSDLRPALMLLNNILGADNMNSRLNLSIREREGLVYAIDSSYTPFSDSGLVTIYTCCDPGKLKRVNQLIRRELDKLAGEPMKPKVFTQAVRQFQARIAMAEESRQSLMLALGKSLLDYQRVDTLEELMAKLEAVTAEQIRSIAEQIFAEERLCKLVFRP